MPPTLADRLVEFALTTRFEDLPTPVVAEAKRRLLDALACAAGALAEPAPAIARRTALKLAGASGGGGTTLIGGGRAAADWSAFANGVHIRYLDCNDTYLAKEPAHPSDNWAAILAVAELASADGPAAIAAAAVAYEVQCRLCDANSIRARGWDHTTYGHLSATLAAAKLLGLDHERTRHALGIAGTTAAALRLTRAGELSMWKGCAFAHAARNAILAATLAAEGLTGPSPLFEGDMGFWQQVSGPFNLTQLGGPDAGDWMLPKTSIKFVPAEYHSQSAIAAAFDLRPRVGDPSRIRSIEIATFRTAVEIIGQDPEKWRPRTRETADHSLPYCTAVALVDGEVSAAQFTAERLADPALLDLVARTTVVEDPELTNGYPHGIPNHVRVTLVDGSTLERRVDFPPGHDQNPLTTEQLRAKFNGLTLEPLGPDRSQALWDRVNRLDADPRPYESLSLLTCD